MCAVYADERLVETLHRELTARGFAALDKLPADAASWMPYSSHTTARRRESDDRVLARLADRLCARYGTNPLVMATPALVYEAKDVDGLRRFTVMFLAKLDADLLGTYAP